MSTPAIEIGERLQSDMLRSARAAAAMDRFAAASRMAERAWRQQAEQSWTAAAESLVRTQGVVRIVVGEIEGGVKTFTRPADTLRGILPALRATQLLDVHWSAP